MPAMKSALANFHVEMHAFHICTGSNCTTATAPSLSKVDGSRSGNTLMRAVMRFWSSSDTRSALLSRMTSAKATCSTDYAPPPLKSLVMQERTPHMMRPLASQLLNPVLADRSGHWVSQHSHIKVKCIVVPCVRVSLLSACNMLPRAPASVILQKAGLHHIGIDRDKLLFRSQTLSSELCKEDFTPRSRPPLASPRPGAARCAWHPQP